MFKGKLTGLNFQGFPAKNEERPEILQLVGSSYAISFKKHVAYTGLPKSPDLYLQRAFAGGFREGTKFPSTGGRQFRTNHHGNLRYPPP